MRFFIIFVAVLLMFVVNASAKGGQRKKKIQRGGPIELNWISLLFTENICDLPHIQNEDGFGCHGLFIRYHYNRTAGGCQKVGYGGCDATANDFDTLDDCEAVCGGRDQLVFH